MQISHQPMSMMKIEVKMACIISVFCFATAITSSAQAFTTLVNFGGTNGAGPLAPVLQGTDGNLYGTTMAGGYNNGGCGTSLANLPGCGTVFKVTTAGRLTTLYAFCPQDDCPDGLGPSGGLVQSTDGNFYGTTTGGGVTDPPCYVYGCGTVFKITPAGSLTTLYRFCSQANCTDGSDPLGGLVQGTDGNFYGTTSAGGTGGTVFKITPAGTLTVLYNFCSQPNCTDGYAPFAGLVQARDGNFYGTTSGGGVTNRFLCDWWGCGTVFKITPGGTLTTLYTFCSQSPCPDGKLPYGALVQAATDGNLYGTTLSGGIYDCGDGCGTVFKITPAGVLTTLHSFVNSDGFQPLAGLVQATDGNLYGTTSDGGATGYGTIFKIISSGTLTTLHSFDRTDGVSPWAALVQATDGTLYGTALNGGTNCGPGYGCGTVFRLTIETLIPTTTVLVTAPNPSNLGQPVTMTATVTAQDDSIPSGTVVFNSNSLPIGSVPLNGSGVAVLIYAGSSLGTDSLQAAYRGSGSFAGSTSNTVLQLVGATHTAVTSTPNPSMFGQVVTITATVSPGEPGGPTPTGTLSFTSNGNAISGCTAVPLTSQLTAVCTTSTLAVGTDALMATYSGDSNYSGSSASLSQLVNPIPSPLQFVAVTPCRLVDTRQTGGAIQGGNSRDFPVQQEGGCNIPGSAAAYSLNISVVPQGPLGYLTIWPTGEGRPVVATLNSLDGRIKADAAIVPAGTNGAVSVYVTQTANVILDINGYFAAASGSTLAFYPLTPCRIADTRKTNFPQGLGAPFLPGQQERDFPILNATSCNIPASAVAYSLNFSVAPHGGLGYMTVWPTGQPRPLVSTLNDVPGTIIANAAIVPAGTSGDVSVYPSNDTDVIIDINGYFAPAGTGGLSLYPVAPCRVIDTRKVGSGQPFSGTLTPPVNVTGSFCGPPATAQAYVFNATVVPTGGLGYLTLWPDGQPKPLVSTLNALDGSITNNMAIVPSTNGKVDAFASGITQLILDISSYFAP